MPASIAHMLISKQVRERLQDSGDMTAFANTVLSKHPQYMDLGSQGPDLPYFASWKSLINPHRPVGVDQWSYQLHSKNPNLFPLQMMEIIGKESDPKVVGWEDRDNIKVAYLCGFLTHVAADQIIHPIVNEIAGPYYFRHDARAAHQDCEVHQDIYLLSKEKRFAGRLSREQFNAERFDSYCDLQRDGEQSASLASSGFFRSFSAIASSILATLCSKSPCSSEFAYFLQKAFVEAHAVTPEDHEVRKWIQRHRAAMRLCNQIPWGRYSRAFSNLFHDDGTPRADSPQYNRYIELKESVGKTCFNYDEYVERALQLAEIYIRALYKLYMAPRIDDPLRYAFTKVVVNADLGSPLQKNALATAKEHLDRWDSLVSDYISHSSVVKAILNTPQTLS